MKTTERPSRQDTAKPHPVSEVLKQENEERTGVSSTF